jgi:hypothetical protein
MEPSPPPPHILSLARSLSFSLACTRRRFATLEEYPDYCVLKEAGSTECADMDLSFPLQFYGLDHDWSCPLLEESVVEAKVTSMIESLDDEDGIGMLQYGFFFDKYAMDN